MGYALSWAAVKGGDRQSIHSILGLRLTGQREEVAESDIVGSELPGGWYLVPFNGTTIEDRFLEKLSCLGELVYCFVEDHVLFSSASGWKIGKTVWSATHDCEKGRLHLEIQGMPPEALEGIQTTLVAQQRAAGGEKADVDYIYDIPAELAKALTGFRHDENIPGMSGEIFHALEPVKEARGIFGRLFGKKGRQ